MNLANYEFQYNAGNLNLLTFSNLGITGIILMIVFIAIGIGFHLFSPYFIAYKMILLEEKDKASKKDKIKELILMKEIQGDVEKEIEESLLNIGLKTSSLKT